jgi:hypothetical protein
VVTKDNEDDWWHVSLDQQCLSWDKMMCIAEEGESDASGRR